MDERINTIGKRIKYFRDWLKETQEVFAPRMGIAKPTLVSYENGGSDPGAKKLEKLYNSVKNTDWEIDLNWFILGKGDMFKDETRESKIEIELRKRIDELQKKLIEAYEK